MKVQIPCPCPESPHESDTVTFSDTLDSTKVLAITKLTSLIENDDPRTRPGEILAVISEGYVIYGVSAWTLRDASNKPLPISASVIRAKLLDNPDVAWRVIDAADELYNKAVLFPLVARASSSSPPSPTDESTSPTPSGSPKRPKPSKPSSISTIPTDATEATSSSLDGVSSSSLSSESAA